MQSKLFLTQRFNHVFNTPPAPAKQTDLHIFTVTKIVNCILHHIGDEFSHDQVQDIIAEGLIEIEIK